MVETNNIPMQECLEPLCDQKLTNEKHFAILERVEFCTIERRSRFIKFKEIFLNKW